jgi:cytochrome P450
MALDRQDGRPVPAGVEAPAGPLGFWASYRAARRNVLELIPEAAYRERVLQGGRGAGWIILCEPAAIERVLKTREPAYPKSSVTLRLMSPREGRNLITADRHTWRWQRRAMAPMFAPRALEGAAPAMTDAAESASRRLDGAAGGTLDVYPVMIDATCDVICDIALSGREALDRSALKRSIDRYVERIARVSFFDLAGVPNWVPRPAEIVDRSRARMDRMTDAIIAARQARGPSDPPDLLDLILAAEDPETGRRMDAGDTRNNLLGLLFAGHETTALALTWALYLLALDPEVQERAASEARAALGGRAAGAADAPALGYVRQVVEETLRLYPPAGFMTRTALEDDELAGRTVRSGATVILPIYALHRHETLWERPQAFDPDRFAPAAAGKRNRYQHLPFGAGPKVCIGYALAMMEAEIILATLLARFEVSLPEGFRPEPRMWFTLRPHGGMPLTIRRRAA